MKSSPHYALLFRSSKQLQLPNSLYRTIQLARCNPHPVLRSVTRRQLVESSPTRPLRTTLHNNGRNSGEIRCSATSGDMLFMIFFEYSFCGDTVTLQDTVQILKTRCSCGGMFHRLQGGNDPHSNNS